MVGAGFSAGNDGSQGVLCPLPARSLYDHPLRSGFYDQAHLEGLVESIKVYGLLEPALVRPRGDKAGEYEILAGHYRVRAIRRLRRSMVMCRVTACDDHTAKMIFYTSRLLTKGLTAIEEALILREMIIGQSLSMGAAGSLFGHGKSWVSRRLKLLAALEPGLQDEVSRGLVVPRVAVELARLSRDNGDQTRVLTIAKKFHLNKEEVRELVNQWLTADEAEKVSLAQSFRNHCPAGGPKPKTLSAREAQARQQLRSCKETLDDLLELIVESSSPIAGWWPWLAWRKLMISYEDLAAQLGPLAESREGGASLGMAASGGAQEAKRV